MEINEIVNKIIKADCIKVIEKTKIIIKQALKD